MNWLTRMIAALAGPAPLHGRCPICGADAVKSKIAKPLGPFVKDGPTVAEMSCPKCGHKWCLPLRVGP